MHDLFVSYAHEDKPLVRGLVEEFRKQNWSVWWDDMMGVGTKFSRVLDDAINQSRCIVVCWTKNALRSDYVLSEAHRGDARHILVPLQLEDVQLPGPFNEYTTANLSTWPDGEGALEFQKLLKDIGGRLALAATTVPVDTSAYVPGFLGSPAVAVLPFTTAVQQSESDYVLDAVTEDVIDRLQRFRWIPVISSASTFGLKRRDPGNLRDIALQLGVQYLVTGQAREVGEQRRLRIELTKVDTLTTVWTTTVTLAQYEDSTLQDELSHQIAAQLETEIERTERRTASFLPEHKGAGDTWRLVRQGIWHQYKLSKPGADTAYELFHEALALDPDCTEALVQLAWWHFWDITQRRGDPSEWIKPAEYARRAANIDPHDCRPVTLLGISHMMRSQHKQAREFYQRAIDLNPSYSWAYAHMGSSLYLDDDPEASLVYTTKAVRLSPLDFFVFHAYCDMATSHYMLKNYSSALEAANYSLGLRSGYWLAHVIKVSTLVRMGRTRDAQSAYEDLVKSKPNISAHDIDWVMFSNRSRNDDLRECLVDARTTR